jgi:hypothetical protein
VPRVPGTLGLYKALKETEPPALIILDTNILRGFKLDSVSSDLLKTIRTAGVESVGAPWVVLEELASHRAVPYREKHEAAAEALQSFTRATPWPVAATLPPLELERFQQHWREQYLKIVDEIPTSGTALREAAFREANVLPPCKAVAVNERGDQVKTGGRDAAIWLTAVEYARDHPEETVYFVSKNTKDFGDGTAYPSPMDKDLEGIQDRFVHLTSLGDVVKKFAVPTEADEEKVREILAAPETVSLVAEEAKRAMSVELARFHSAFPLLFECTTAHVVDLGTGALTNGAASTAVALGWMATPTALFDSVRDVEAHRIGEHVWCTATARWLLGGLALLHSPSGAALVGCAWETRVLVSPTNSEAKPALLRNQVPRAITVEELSTLPAPALPARSKVTIPQPRSWKNVGQSFTTGALTSGASMTGVEAVAALVVMAAAFWSSRNNKDEA